jgi:plastocyanin
LQFLNIFQEDLMKKRKFALSFAPLALCLMVAVATSSAHAQWTATVGAENSDMGHQALAFLPNEIWIHAGQSITWTFDANDIHTVTFLPDGQVRLPFPVGCPGFSADGAIFDGSTCVTTPPLVKGQTFTVNFPTTGNFKLVCLVHENMTGRIHVLDAATPLPHGQGYYDRLAKTERASLLRDDDLGDDHEGHAIISGTGKNDVVAGTGEAVATGAGAQQLSIMRFMHDKIVIHAGQTVEWTNGDPITPHTITFGTEPPDPMPPSSNVTIDADGARHATINALSDSVASGFIIADSQERIGLPQQPIGVTRMRITFTHAGTYPYICALHDNLGMVGKVVVLP